MYEFDFATFRTALGFVAQGIPLTFAISASALVLGVVIGLPAGVARASSLTALSRLLGVFVEVFRNVPVLVQIVWIYYVIPILTGHSLDAVTAGIIALGLNTGAFLAEIFRGGIQGVAEGQREAAITLGFSATGTLRYVVLPQVLRKMATPLLNQFIVLVKESALVAYIGVVEVMHRGDMVSTQMARPLEAYTVVALWYFLICYGASLIARRLENITRVPE